MKYAYLLILMAWNCVLQANGRLCCDILQISTFKWGGTTALDPDRVDRRGYHV